MYFFVFFWTGLGVFGLAWVFFGLARVFYLPDQRRAPIFLPDVPDAPDAKIVPAVRGAPDCSMRINGQTFVNNGSTFVNFAPILRTNSAWGYCAGGGVGAVLADGTVVFVDPAEEDLAGEFAGCAICIHLDVVSAVHLFRALGALWLPGLANGRGSPQPADFLGVVRRGVTGGIVGAGYFDLYPSPDFSHAAGLGVSFDSSQLGRSELDFGGAVSSGGEYH